MAKSSSFEVARLAWALSYFKFKIFELEIVARPGIMRRHG
jgi:hypothetical protein